MMPLLISEWTALRKSAFTWFCMALLALCSGAQILAAYLLVKLNYASIDLALISLKAPDFLFTYVLPSNIIFGIPLIIFLGSMNMGGGYAWSTIRWPLEMGFSRTQVVFGKTLPILFAGMIGGCVNLILGAILGLLVNHWLGLPIHIGFDRNMAFIILAVYFVTILSFWAYATITTMWVILSRSAILGLSVGLLLFLLEYLLSQVVMPGAGPWDVLRPVSLLGNIYRLVKPPEGEMLPVFNLLSFGVVLAHSCLWIIVAQFIFHRQDIHA